MIVIHDDHAARLQRMRPAIVTPALGEELEAGAQAIVDFARANILDGAISGSGHVPGPEGGFPNADTHELDESLRVGELIETDGQIQTAAIADAPHARYVERGTSKAGPRPYMEPSTEELRADIVGNLHKRFKSIVGL